MKSRGGRSRQQRRWRLRADRPLRATAVGGYARADFTPNATLGDRGFIGSCVADARASRRLVLLHWPSLRCGRFRLAAEAQRPRPVARPAASSSKRARPQRHPRHLQIDGTTFRHAAGQPFQWRGITAFRLLEYVARRKEADGAAPTWRGPSQKLTVVRVLAMGSGFMQLTPDEGRARARPAARRWRRSTVCTSRSSRWPNTREHAGRASTSTSRRSARSPARTRTRCSRSPTSRPIRRRRRPWGRLTSWRRSPPGYLSTCRWRGIDRDGRAILRRRLRHVARHRARRGRTVGATSSRSRTARRSCRSSASRS